VFFEQEEGLLDNLRVSSYFIRNDWQPECEDSLFNLISENINSYDSISENTPDQV